jgi:hypothetical protein
MTWHVDSRTAERYLEHSLDATDAGSVESHVLMCEQCRTDLGVSAGRIDEAALGVAWSAIVEHLDQPAVGWVERLLHSVGCSDVLTRVVAATTRARLSFLVAVSLSLFLAIVAAQSPEERYFGMFLMIAPLAPLVATGGAFGSWSDPVHELARTVPTSALRILLVRVAASVVPTIALTAVSIPWLIDRGWLAVAWLLPSLALALGALALSSWVSIEVASLLLGGLWISVPMTMQLPLRELLDLLGRPTQLTSLIVGAVAIAITLTRRDAFDYREA